MKQNSILKPFAFIIAFAFLLSAFAGRAFASVTPTLSLSATGNGDSVQVNVTGDPSTSVILYYTPSNTGLLVAAIGNTNASGVFSSTLSSATYGLTTGNSVYVSVGGVNGLKSATASWPTVNTTGSSLLSLSQTGLAMSVGQTSTVTATNNTQNTLYIANNTNSTVASAAINGNQITILALGYGSTSITICSVGNTTNCPNVNVTVQNGNTQTLTLSQNNVSVTYGQNTSVTISGGTGTYIVSNNSSSGNVSTSISGNTLLIGGNSATNGTYSVTVCSSDMSSCGVVNVTLGTSTSSTVSFSQSSPTLSAGQSLTVSIYGNTSTTYYISSNSNPGIVQASISGNSLVLLGAANGTATINVCASAGGCSTLTATVNSSSASLVYLSQNSLTIGVGQTSSVTLAGGIAPYVLLTPSNTFFQAGVSGNSLYITGISIGSAQVTVCSTGSTGCTSLSLQVTGTQTTPTPTTATTFLNFSSANPTLSAGQTTSISTSGGTGSGYSVVYNSNSNIVQASMNGGLLSLHGLINGHAVIVVCDTATDCGALAVTVGATTNTTTNTGLPAGCLSTSGFSTTTGVPCGTGTLPVTTTPTPTATSYYFTEALKFGSKGEEVFELQKRLRAEGYLTATANSYFGPATEKAVKAYQKAHGLAQLGVVGPGTRAALNR